MLPLSAFTCTFYVGKGEKMSYLNDLEDIWEQVKISLAKDITPSIMELWFGPIKIHSYDDENNKLIFETTSEFNYNILSKKYIPLLKKAFSELLGFEQDIGIIFTGEHNTPEKILKQLGIHKEPEQKKEEEKPAEEIRSEGILPIDYSFQYTFDNFIVGSSNNFAHAACTAVAARPAADYNPLFIYGPSGLGKTHLMSAIVNEIKKKNPLAKVIYIKGEDFINQMIDSLSRQEMHKFHEKFRGCDMLLIDDIQFIAGKERMQEEFFHTFNTLYENRKQIVLSSDRPPKDIQPLEERLKSRFEWGIIADIQPPDLELRIAIIKKKAEQLSIELSPEILTFLAENLRSNIRQIEGMIKKLSAIVFLQGKTITMEIAAACLQELTGGVVPVQVIVDKVFSAVHSKYGIPKDDLLSQKRNKDIAFARHVSVYLIKNVTEMSYPGIAKIFNRNHTTLISSYELVAKKRNSDPMFNIEISELLKEVSSNV